MTDALLRRGRFCLGLSFLAQGMTFALLVTRIPGIQDRYEVSDGLLPLFLAAVPVLAGVGSVVAERLVRRVAPSAVLRWSQPVVLLSLLAVGLGEGMAQLACALAVFGLAVGALDATMNMLGVSLQRSYGRSIMLGFHAVYSLGGILGASLAYFTAGEDMPLWAGYGPAVALLLPLTLVGSRWYLDRDGRTSAPKDAGKGAATEDGRASAAERRSVGFRLLLPLCLVMTCTYIGDATVSNWSAKYVEDVLGGSERLATLPYNVYMVTTLLGRTVGDLGVRRFGPVAVVRAGAVTGSAGFAVVAAAPSPAVGMAGFTLLGLGLCVMVPQTFAAAGRVAQEHAGPEASDRAVARLNIFNYVGFVIGSPLVGALGDTWNYRGAMLVPMALVLVTLVYAPAFAPGRGRYGDEHERARAVDVGRGGNRL